DRGEARLHAQRLVLFDLQAPQLLELAHHLRMVRGISEAAQREDRVDDGRKDRAEAAALFQPGEDPGLGLAEGALAKRLPREPLRGLQPAVDPEEDGAPEALLPAARRNGPAGLRGL